MVNASMQRFQRQKVSKQQSNAGEHWVPDLVRFDQDQITDVSEAVPVHFWLDHILTVDQCRQCYRAKVKPSKCQNSENWVLYKFVLTRFSPFYNI